MKKWISLLLVLAFTAGIMMGCKEKSGRALMAEAYAKDHDCKAKDVKVEYYGEFEGCHVVDGLNATGGQRMLVEQACRLRDAGKSAAQIVEQIESLRGRVRLYACLNTLENLYRGGRISHTVYKVGSMAQIKPIISIDTAGKVAVPGKAMGMRKGMDTLCKYLDTHQPDPDFPVYLMYTNQRSAAESLGQRMEAHGHSVSGDRIIGVGAAIGTHIGPAACGVVYIEKE